MAAEMGVINRYKVILCCVYLPEPTTTTPAPEIGPIGFTAHATQSRWYDPGEVIEFDSVQSNFGGYYSSTTYTFRCPYTGVYLFNCGINSYESYLMCDIVKDHVLLGSAYAEHIQDETHSYPQASAIVIVQCNAGQNVWTEAQSAVPYLSVAHSRSTQFVGFLLHQL